MSDNPFSDLAPVREWHDVDRARFEAEIQPLQEPAVMRGLAADWPLVQAAQGGAAAAVDALKRYGSGATVRAYQAPHSVGGRFFYNDDFSWVNFETITEALPEFLDRILAEDGKAEPDAVFAGAVPVRDALGTVAEDHVMPLLPAETERLTSLWIGNRTRTAPHWDLPQNIAVPLAGRRRFVLFPIEAVPDLYVGPLDFTLAGQPISLVDPRAPELERFPNYTRALETARTVELAPGDALYLPSLHVHYVESLDAFGLMMNFWWRDGPEHLATPFLTLMHGLLTLRDMPEAERMRWKVLFDHYLFQTNGDPMAHLPEGARGLFGEQTPERIQRIRAHLAKTLTR